MCCLGFLAREMGYKPCKIRMVHSPAYTKDSSLFPDTIVFAGDNTNLCNNMMTINDTCYITDEQREAKLKRLFKRAGIGIKFVD